ncbi:MAG: glycosyltransferase [Candidatus Contendobacter sp.]
MMHLAKNFKKNTPHIVCIPVLKNEELLLDSTLKSVVAHTAVETAIVVVLLMMGQEILSSYQQKKEIFGQRIQWVHVSVSEPCLPYLALCYLPPQYNTFDIALILPGVIVPSGWDARMALVAVEYEYIASVSPLCDKSSLFALLESDEAQKSNFYLIDQAAYRLGEKIHTEVPTLLCGCVYLKRSALEKVWTDLISRRILHLGEFCWLLGKAFNSYRFHNVCCDHVYILDKNEEHLTVMDYIEKQEEVRLINQNHPFVAVRRAVKDFLAGMENGTSVDYARRRPLQLHIAHTWGGGQERWLKDYCENDTTRLNFVLRSIGTWGVFGRRLVLHRSHAMDDPLRSWTLFYPIRSTTISHLQYKEILREIIDEFGVEVIIISSLIGHSLDALDTGINTIFIAHDYYPFCHQLNIYFNEICHECSAERLQRCFIKNEQNRHFANMTSLEWLGIRENFIKLLLNQDLHVVCPSASVARHMKALIPQFQEKDFIVIPHGMRFTVPQRVHNSLSHGEKMRVLILGSLVLHKGRKLLEDIYPKLKHNIDFYLVGCGEEGRVFSGKSGVYLIPEYVHEQLPEIVAKINPHLGLLLSIVPETYSYTLSELWILGIPVVATSVGSFKDRIILGLNGFTCQPTAEDIVEKLNFILKNPASLDPLRHYLATFKHRTAKEMVEDYHALTPLPEFSFQRYFAKQAHSPAAVSEVPTEASPLLIISPQAGFISVLQEFQRYVLMKLTASPRFKRWQKKLLTFLVGSVFKLSNAIAKMAPMR